MSGVEVKGLKDVNQILDDFAKEFPNARRELHKQIGQEAFKIVQNQIALTSKGNSKKSGTVRAMQKIVVGSGGGYVAIKPRKGQSGANSPGAITNYNENGHQIRKPTGLNRRYRPRIHIAYVNGRHFYQKSVPLVETAVIRRSEKFADDLVKKIGG